MIEQIELQTNDDTSILRMTEIEKFADGGYGCVLDVRSGGFSCQRPFYFDDAYLLTAVHALRQMNSGLVGEATIKARWEHDAICIASNAQGHVLVTGEVVEYSEFTQSMKFAFRTDQTVLGPLIRDLERLAEA